MKWNLTIENWKSSALSYNMDIIIIIIILLKQNYKIQLTNNKLQMAWLTSSLRELPALIFRNWVHFKQIYVYMLYIIYVIYVKYDYYTYILLKM